VNIRLTYPSKIAGRPHEAEALAEVRVTPKQVVVVSAEITFRLRPTSHPRFHNRGFPSGGPLRFWRKNGRELGHSWMTPGWSISREQLDRIEKENPSTRG